jgi:hypothetical protein
MEINLKIQLMYLNIKSGCSGETNRTGRGRSATISVVLDFAVVYRRVCGPCGDRASQDLLPWRGVWGMLFSI